MSYDPIKAKALFEQHVKPAHTTNGRIVYLNPDCGPTTHYVITPEMFGVLRYATNDAYFYRQADQDLRDLRHALWNFMLGVDRIVGPDDEWAEAIQPDPIPAWRVAADKARDEGLEFSAVLDAIAAELEAK